MTTIVTECTSFTPYHVHTFTKNGLQLRRNRHILVIVPLGVLLVWTDRRKVWQVTPSVGETTSLKNVQSMRIMNVQDPVCTKSDLGSNLPNHGRIAYSQNNKAG